MVKFSEIFEVSVLEIINGEKKESNTGVLKIYDEYIKHRKKLLLFLVILILIFCFYFTYYFINQYNSVVVYTIFGKNDNFIINNGILVKTREKIYFVLGNIETEKKYDSLQLYSYNNKKEKLIVKTTNKTISFKDFYGYSEYIDFKKFNNIYNNF